MWQKHKQVGKDAGKYTLVSLFVTGIDFLVLNIGTIVFHLPLILANIISTTTSSAVNFNLNKRLTFAGRRHGRARTVVRFVLIVGFAIYVLQTAILYVIGGHFNQELDSVIDYLKDAGLMPGIPTEIIRNNIAKLCASWLASIWTFFMLRRFVFLPKDVKTQAEDE